MLFDEPEPPWEEHDCSATGTIGRSGLKGWDAVDVLRANSVGVSSRIMALAFPKDTKPQQSKTVVSSLASVAPKVGQTKDILASIRELLMDTQKIKALKSLGGVGAKLLRLPKGSFCQVTLVTNNSAYTCIMPTDFGLTKDDKNRMVFAHLESRVGGTHAIWLITDIRVV